MFLLSEVQCSDSVVRKVRVLFKTRLIFPRINGPIVTVNANYNNGASRTIVKPFGYTAENVAGADGSVYNWEVLAEEKKSVVNISGY